MSAAANPLAPSAPAASVPWYDKLANLLPIIAYGVQAIAKDAQLGDKQDMAKDAFTVALAGATVELPDSDQPLVNAFGKLGASVLNSTLQVIHNAQTPTAAPAAA